MVCAAQDFFETRLLSMDTDFRVLSADYLGALPGIDIAQVSAHGLPLTVLHGHMNSHSSLSAVHVCLMLCHLPGIDIAQVGVHDLPPTALHGS